MKIAILLLFICACFVAVRVLRIITTPLPNLASATMHIAAAPFTLNEIIGVASRKHRVSPAFIKSIIAAESAFSPTALSLKGAIGLMQLMPQTANQFAVDPTVPAQNIDGGTRYLSWLLQRYAHKRDRLRRVIAAYNAGPGAVERYKGVPPFRETRAYVSRVLRFYKTYLKTALRDERIVITASAKTNRVGVFP